MEQRNRIFTSVAILIIGALIFYLIANRDDAFTRLNEKTGGESQKTEAGGDSRTYLEVVNDIVTGKNDEVPSRFKKTKELIILEYLHGCYKLNNTQIKIDCYELYYLNNFDDIKSKKELCKNSEKEVSCLDEYYAEMSKIASAVFCEPISDDSLKITCKKSIPH